MGEFTYAGRGRGHSRDARAVHEPRRAGRSRADIVASRPTPVIRWRTNATASASSWWSRSDCV